MTEGASAHFGGKYVGIYYLLHFSALKVFLYLTCFLHQIFQQFTICDIGFIAHRNE